jgi:hypothetical protein
MYSVNTCLLYRSLAVVSTFSAKGQEQASVYLDSQSAKPQLQLVQQQEKSMKPTLESQNVTYFGATTGERVRRARSVQRIGIFLPLLGLKPSTDTSKIEQQVQIESLVIQSWRLMAELLDSEASLPPFIAIHTYGMVEEAAHCNPAWDRQMAGRHFTCMVLPLRCLHPGYANTPTIDCILQTMATTSSKQHYDYAVLANGDLLFPAKPFVASMRSVVAWHENKIVLVGQRTDTTWDQFWSGGNFSRLDDARPLHLDEYERLHENAREPSHGAVHHPDFGVDYFVMSASLLPTDFPPFLVGRFRWDNVLLARFLVDGGGNGVAVVDATAALPVLHLGGMYSSDPKYHYNRVGARYNDALTREYTSEFYKLGRIRNAAWRLEETRVPDTPRRQTAYEFQPRPSYDRPNHVPLLAIARASGGPLLLLTVLPRELMYALEWLDQTQRVQNTAWFFAHYLFVALDQETYDVLEATAPGYVILEDMTDWPRPPTALSWKSFGRLLKQGQMPVAILSATALRGIDHHLNGRLVAYADKAATCGAVMMRENNELLSVQPQSPAGMTFWRQYRAQGGAQFKKDSEGLCWV